VAFRFRRDVTQLRGVKASDPVTLARDERATAKAPQSQRRLIINADDFGASIEINEAVVRAHREGVLTSASLMVNEEGCQEAVALARAHPGLGVGLHLVFVCGRSALPPGRIPGLVNEQGQFSSSPAAAGFRYFFNPALRDQLRAEIHEQFARFRATGLPLDHVNGHLHLHLHPTVFKILMEDAAELGIERLRCTFDPLGFNLRLASGRWGYRLLHAVIFHFLARRARPLLRARGIHHTPRVFGLLQHARVDESFLLRLLPQLPAGDSELYSHPSLREFEHEFAALVSPRVRAQVEQLGVKLIRYQDL
jgi:chitin disaccharide deacetylase